MSQKFIDVSEEPVSIYETSVNLYEDIDSYRRKYAYSFLSLMMGGRDSLRNVGILYRNNMAYLRNCSLIGNLVVV